jgi:hypothetical protein
MSSTQPGRPALALALAGLLALLGALAWLVQLGHSTRSEELARTEERQRDAQRGPEDAALEAPRADGAEPTSAPAPVAARNLDPSATLGSARIHASSRDAQSGAAIPGMRLDFVEDVSAPSVARVTYARADADGIVDRERFPSGRWRVSASSSRHRLLALGIFETLPDERLELGRITLAPLPTHRGILRDEYGRPVAQQWITLPFVPVSGESVDPTLTDEKGAFELNGDLPRTLVLQANPSGPLRSVMAQRFAVERWDADTLLELQLAAYQHVIVSLYDIPAEGEELQVNVCPDAEEATESGQHTYPDNNGHVPLLRAREVQPGAEGRRFEFYAAAGHLQVWGGSRSIRIPPTRLALAADAADPEFSIRAR